jgi:integrase
MIVKLTQSLVDSYVLPENTTHDRELVHEGRLGLYLLVSKSGNKTFFIRYRSPVSGKTSHKKLGSASDISLAKAKEMTKIIRADIAQGIDPKAEVKVRKESMIFRDYFYNIYMKKYAEVRKRSSGFDLKVFKRRIEPSGIADKKLIDISRKDLYDLQGSLMESKLANGTVNRAISLLKGCLSRAVEFELLEKNVGTRFPMLPENGLQNRFLNDDELARLMSVLWSDHNRPVCHILIWLISTGARLNEALTARASDVDESSKAWTINAEQAKNKRSRVVPLNSVALKALSERYSNSEWLWPNPKTGKPYTTITRVWYRLKKEAGIENCRIHDLRHTFGSYLAQANVSGSEIMAALGHQDFRTTLRYLHRSHDDGLRVSAHVADRISNAMKSASGEN